MVGNNAGEQDRSLIPWSSGILYVIIASALIGVMGVSLISPVLPQLRDIFDISDAQVGLVITAYTLPGIFLTPFIGIASDRIGRRRVIIPFLFVFGIAGAGISFMNSFSGLLVLRFLQGIGASALVTLALTLIGDFYQGERRDAVIGVNASMLGTGAALYPFVGGVLASIRWNAPFLFFGIAILVGLFAITSLPEPDGYQSSSMKTSLWRLRDVAIDPQAIAIFSAIFVIFFVFYGAIQTALPLILSDDFTLGAREIGAILAMVSVAMATVSSQFSRISQRWTAPELVALGFIAYGISLLGIWLAPTPIAVAVSLLAFGVGFGIVMPSVDTTIILLVPNRLRAGMIGMRTSVLRLGQTLGPISFTYIAETAFVSTTVGYRFLILIFGVLIILIGIIAYILLRQYR